MNSGKIVATVFIAASLVAGHANAHVVFNQNVLPPATLATLELRVTHGCDGSATKEVRVKLPEGVTRVTPRALAGWQVAVTKRQLPSPVTLHGQTVTETLDTVIWSGGSFPDFAYQQFEIRAMMPSQPNRTLYFPVEQICESGQLSWSQIPVTPAGWSALKEPAPFVTTGSANAQATSSRHH
jgi:periplasmic copper chaperone A